MQRASADHPSPVLPIEQVHDILVERNGALGAVGGAVGGGIGGGAPGAVGGGFGGRAGGRFGARRLAKVKGLTQALPVPWTADAVARVRAIVAPIDVQGASEGVLAGVIGAGALDMNGAVVQLVWHGDHVEVTAHGLEGLIDQRTAADAISKVEAALTAS